MAEYIDKAALVKSFEERIQKAEIWRDDCKDLGVTAEFAERAIIDFNEAMLRVKNFQTVDAVEVIRCRDCRFNDPTERDKVVEEWAKEHPARTRQSEFLKIFPNAVMTVADNLKVVAICPKLVDIKFIEPICEGVKCVKCEKDYWLQEVE